MSVAGFLAIRRAALAFAIALGGAAMAQQAVEVPSGQPMELTEVLVDDSPGETWVRFRFVAPQIAREGGTVSFDVASADMDHLCETLVLPYLAEYQLEATRVVLSLSDRPVEFGASSPEATQFFQSYNIDGDACVWEPF